MKIKKNITLMYSIFTCKNALYVLSFALIKIQARANDKIIYIFTPIYSIYTCKTYLDYSSITP